MLAAILSPVNVDMESSYSMAARRMLSKKIWESDQVEALTIPERLLYIALITLADDEGCFRADAKHWKRTVFYNDAVSVSKVEEMLNNIRKVGLIILGESEKGWAGFHPNWHRYQQLRAERSKSSDYSDILVANERTPRFHNAAEDRLGQDKKNQSSSNQGNRDESLLTTKNLSREKMLKGIEEAKKGLSQKMNADNH